MQCLEEVVIAADAPQSVAREKSATKEAIALLSSYLDKDLNTQHPQHDTRYPNSPSDAGISATQPHSAADQQRTPHVPTETPPCQPAYTFSMTKLASSGIVMLQLQRRTNKQDTDVVTHTDLAPGSCGNEAGADRVGVTEPNLPNRRPAQVVHKILVDLQAGALSPPEFCERIIPVQLTCGLTAQALKGAAARIAALHSREVVQAAAGSPIKLAVTYKGRGSGSKDRKSPVDRSLAIAIVADAVEDAVKRCGGTVKVDLKSPQVVMMVEVLPITPSPICALCWLPGTMTQANKLLVKPMVAPER
ncbi:hypothetical protein ABBQ32_000672 [Trebouxia sp. C0010 RCD-2024]